MYWTYIYSQFDDIDPSTNEGYGADALVFRPYLLNDESQPSLALCTFASVHGAAVTQYRCSC